MSEKSKVDLAEDYAKEILKLCDGKEVDAVIEALLFVASLTLVKTTSERATDFCFSESNKMMCENFMKHKVRNHIKFIFKIRNNH